jgi:sugar phosphate isomerase/epimerase
MSSLSRRRFLQASGGIAVLGVAAEGTAQPPAQPAVRFRPGIVTYNIAAAWDRETIIKILRSVGMPVVELRTTHKHGVEPELSPAQRKLVRQQFADGGVEIWGTGSVCEFHSPDPAVVRQNIDTCKQFVQLTADIGGKGVKVRPNGLPRNVEPAKTLEQIGKSLIECGRAAADAGIEIWVEVHGAGTSLPANVKTIMEHCGHPRVGVCWNSNDTDIRNGSVAEAFNLLRPWIKSCHINQLYKDSRGEYPYRELFRLLREAGYDRVTLAELGRGMPDPGSGEELLRYYRALWTELTR